MNAVVADQRVGEGQHLTGEGRVGQGFLIAHHAGGEYQFACTDGLGAEQLARISSTVCGQKDACTRCAVR